MCPKKVSRKEKGKDVSQDGWKRKRWIKRGKGKMSLRMKRKRQIWCVHINNGWEKLARCVPRVGGKEKKGVDMLSHEVDMVCHNGWKEVGKVCSQGGWKRKKRGGYVKS